MDREPHTVTPPDPTILFEDEHVIAVDKPEGLASIPERTGDAHSLVRLLSAQRGARLYVVHRLDKEASGVLLLAKTPQAHRSLNEQFTDRRIEKRYAALVHGMVIPDRGVIRRPIRQFGSGRMGVDARGGKPSRTAFEVVERLGACTLLELAPTSGRRHQIRVHLFSLGHPVVGDRRYGIREYQKRFPRLMLHATRLVFTSLGGNAISVHSPLPESFTSLMDRLRASLPPE